MRRLLLCVCGAALVSGIAVATSGGATQAKMRWMVTDLGPCPSYNCWTSIAINELGEVSGTSGKTGFLWRAGKRISLGALPGTRSSEALAINERSQIVGSSGYLVSGGRAFLWERGRMRDLGTPRSATSSEAVAVNNAGMVAGTAWKLAGQYELPTSTALTWSDGVLQVLPPLAGDAEGEAKGINERGWIIGWSSPGTFGGGREAVVWRNGRATGLGKLGALSSEPVDINERGQIVGHTVEPDGIFLWENGRMRVVSKRWTDDLAIDDLGRIYGSLSHRVFVYEKGRIRFIGPGEFRAANEHGQVLAWVDRAPRLWKGGKWIALPLLRGHKAGMAIALNERDQIVGWSGNYDYDAQEEDVYKGRLVLWTLGRG